MTQMLKIRKDAVCITTAPDGAAIAVGYHDGHVELRDVETGKARWRVRHAKWPRGRASIVRNVFFSPNGQLLAWSNAKRVHVVSAETGGIVHACSLDESARAYETLPCFAPDNQSLYFANGDAISCLNWGQPSRSHIKLPRPMGTFPVTVSADGKRIAYVPIDYEAENAGRSEIKLYNLERGEAEEPIALTYRYNSSGQRYYTNVRFINASELIIIHGQAGLLRYDIAAGHVRWQVLPEQLEAMRTYPSPMTRLHVNGSAELCAFEAYHGRLPQSSANHQIAVFGLNDGALHCAAPQRSPVANFDTVHQRLWVQRRERNPQTGRQKQFLTTEVL